MLYCNRYLSVSHYLKISKKEQNFELTIIWRINISAINL